MIQKGSLVVMGGLKPNPAITGWPPPGSLCIVISNPRETSTVSRGSQISLKKTVDVLFEGRVFEKCEVGMLIEIKK